MSRKIHNPMGHKFKNEHLHNLIQIHVSLACEFIDNDEDRQALERNILDNHVTIMNLVMSKLLNLLEKGKTKELEETIKSYMTEYL